MCIYIYVSHVNDLIFFILFNFIYVYIYIYIYMLSHRYYNIVINFHILSLKLIHPVRHQPTHHPPRAPPHPHRSGAMRLQQ